MACISQYFSFFYVNCKSRGPNYFKYMYNTHAFYVRDRITFNPNFEELTNRRTVFSPSNRMAMNNEMDLHYFKGLVFFAHISNNKVNFNENLEHITWSAITRLLQLDL